MPEPASGPDAVTAREPSILYLEGVSVSFDGFKALNSLNLIIRRGEMRAIIGPNGAGKTTMMDVVTGKTRPDTGRVLFADDVNLAHLDETDIANLGIGRKFQKPTVFESLTVFENIYLAQKTKRSIAETLFARIRGEQLTRIEATLETIRLTERSADLAGDLSHGQKQWLEIGMLLAQEPELMLLDEPVAGMSDAETEQTVTLLMEIAKDHSLVVVEHDMKFVRNLDCTVSVLHEGSVLAEGPMESVQSDPRVIEVYLGR
ncbi:MAG: urea ABC transporter ATP-binding protein UrtD [Rhodospirillaceae bacterium]|jgi:urea transport system ATP-binding protein|nr:urea ABC transporter ATP-binding protein UrtD [Rhodospirillaceae bacterium]MBT3807944.1 urea ABC transporter ATP-binding protein UrtD [Rhodospirillaceae bacterium]MBT3930600.1 urea ABC transporter ATP-binding protein UrtD [Rhodospirillaceae bacterium]MBT4772398.1 urea ABC transporter ATP-binding protein UrtD [Rhodospirillaceae bacterium]MBT5359652.1 urea ABC transporter ATP-binding protein UrtD [Rhodospirillaceae bacterium]